jgi:hypothetical protein
VRENDLACRFSKYTFLLAIGAVFFTIPALLGTPIPLTIDSAFAKQGGNGNGNGNGIRNGEGNASKSEKTKFTDGKTANVAKGNVSAKISLLNVADVSAKAFANASPNSRIGKIKAYYVANQAALETQATADETDAAAMHGAFMNSALSSVIAAYEALQADPSNVALQDAYNRVVTNSVLTGEQIAAVESTHAEWQSALESDTIAAKAALAAEAALRVAANKTDVSSETRNTLDALLAGKLN